MIINLPSQTNLSGFYVVYEGSTNLEKKGWYGLSHLMEHLMTKNFDHLQEDFDRDGLEWNAYTSSNEICFYLTGLEDKVNKWKGEFMDLLGGFNVKKAEFENERNIVLEEMADAFNEQTQAHMLNLSRKLFGDFDPIGLENLKFMDCLNFFELQYAKPTKIINVSKKDYKNPTLDFADRTIVKNTSYGNHNVPLELNNDWKDKTSIAILSPVINEDFAYVHFINAMLSLGLKSPLYQEVRENQGLVYFIHCYQSRHNLQGITNISTQTNNKNVNKVIDAVEKVLKGKDKFLTKERFNLVKDYYMTRREKEEILRYKNVGQHLVPKDWSVYDILDTIKLKDLKDIYDEYYDFSKFYISNDKKEFQK